MGSFFDILLKETTNGNVKSSKLFNCNFSLGKNHCCTTMSTVAVALRQHKC